METKVIFEDSDILVLEKPAGMIVNRSDTTKGEETVQNWVEHYLKILNPKSQILNSNDQSGHEFRASRHSGHSAVSPSTVSRSTVSSDRIGSGLSNRLSRISIYHEGSGDILESQAKPDPQNDDCKFRNSDFEFFNRAGIVHRLDKETSGILLVAKNPQAFENLQKQFKERKVKKTYLAVVHGKVEPRIGEINVPVGRLPWNRKRFGVLAGGREAVTKYQISNIKYQISNGKKEPLTLLELYPETGRTHQIRVHLKYLNHPIFSDSLYAGRKTARNDRKLLPRIFLHAAKISFCHPKTREIISFESPLPRELNKFLLDKTLSCHSRSNRESI